MFWFIMYQRQQNKVYTYYVRRQCKSSALEVLRWGPDAMGLEFQIA